MAGEQADGRPWTDEESSAEVRSVTKLKVLRRGGGQSRDMLQVAVVVAISSLWEVTWCQNWSASFIRASKLHLFFPHHQEEAAEASSDHQERS